MARNVRTHISDGSVKNGFIPTHLTKEEFGRRVYNLMLKKGWHQSELARQADLPRDAISTYIRGKTLPTAASLSALAGALGVAPEELLPNQIEAAIEADTPSFEIKASTAAPDLAWLRVNRLVTTATAVKIAEILQHDDALNRSGSSAAPALQPLESEAPAAKRQTRVYPRPSRTRRGQ